MREEVATGSILECPVEFDCFHGGLFATVMDGSEAAAEIGAVVVWVS